MRKYSFFLIVVICALSATNLAFSATLKMAAATAPPVELEKGWNLISVPCDIETSALLKNGAAGNSAQTLEKKDGSESEEDDSKANNSDKGNNGKSDENDNSKNDDDENGGIGNGNSGGEQKDESTKFYSWDGEGYEEVDFLYRGVGYIVNTDNIQNTSSVCSPSEVAEPLEIVLKKGWNLVGNPYHMSYEAEKIFGAAYSSISVIYEYSGNKYSELNNSDRMKPWRGYWAYVEDDVPVEVFKTCYVKISADTMIAPVGKTAALEALYACESDSGVVESYDVTNEVEWSSTDGGVIENAVFTRSKNNDVIVSAVYKEIKSNELTFSPVGGFGCDRVVVAQTYDEKANDDGFCGNYTVYEGASSKGGEQCRQCGAGSEIICRKNGADDSKDSYTELWHLTEKIPLKAYCVSDDQVTRNGADGRVENVYEDFTDVSDKAEWKVQNAYYVRLTAEGEVYGLHQGFSAISAKYEGLESLWQDISVIDLETVSSISFKEFYVRMTVNAEKENRLFARHRKTPNGECVGNMISDDSEYCLEDISDKATYTFSGNEVTYENGVVKSGKSNEYANIYATYKAMKNYMRVDVIEPEKMINIVFYPGPYLDLFVNEEREARLYALYRKLETECDNVAEKYYGCSYRAVDITDQAEFTISDERISYVDGVVKVGDEDVSGKIKAVYNNFTTTLTVSAFYPDKPDSIYFSPTSVKMLFEEEKELRLYGRFTLSASGCPTRSCDRRVVDITDKATYSIEIGEPVLSYENGIVRVVGGSSGQVRIKADYAGRSNSAAVTAYDPDEVLSLVFDPVKVTMYPGDVKDVKLKAKYYDTKNNCGTYSYNDCYAYKDVTEDAEINVEGDKATYEKGVVKAGDKSGDDKVVGSYGGKTASLAVSIKDPNELLGIYFDPSSLLMKVNETKQVKLMAKYYDSEKPCYVEQCEYRIVDITKEASYTISSMVVFFKDGEVKAGKEQGTATIEAMYNGKKAEAKVEVNDPEAAQFLLFNLSNSVSVGDRVAFSVIAAYRNLSCDYSSSGDYLYYDYNYDYYYSYDYCDYYNYVNVTDKVEYEYDERMVSLTPGLLKAGDKRGTTEITVRFEGKEAKASIKIVGDDLMRLRVDSTYTKKISNCPASSYCYATYVDENLPLRVYASYVEKSGSKDVTASVTWEISDASKAWMDATGKLIPSSAGLIWVRATYKDLRTEKVWIAIADEKTNRFLIAGLGYSRNNPLMVGQLINLYTAIYEYNKKSYYRVVLKEYVTADRIVLSDDSLVSYQKYVSYNKDSSGASVYNYQLKGKNPGILELSAEYEDMKSNTISFDVWKSENITRCDSTDPNMSVWDDSWSTRATLETDCSTYESDEEVSIVYTAQTSSGALVDNCLDLWVIDENDNIVKTFRYEGCSTESIGRNAGKYMTTVFQTKYVWDMIGDDGKKVPPGNYYATARFYIIYEPVIHTPFTIKN